MELVEITLCAGSLNTLQGREFIQATRGGSYRWYVNLYKQASSGETLLCATRILSWQGGPVDV